MHILILSPMILGFGRTPDTYSSQQINLALSWANDGHHVDVMTGRGEGLDKALAHDRIRLIQLPVMWVGGKGGLPVLIGAGARMRKAAYDLVFSSEHYQPSTFVACLNSSKVLIYQGQNTNGASFLRKTAFAVLEQIVLPLIRRRYLKVVAKTRSAEAFVRARGFKHIVTIPCGYDSERFRLPSLKEKTKSRAALGLSSNARVLVYAGNLLPRRDVAVAVKSISLLRSRGINASLLIAGEGPELNHLQQVAKDEDVGPFIQFLGHLDWRRLREVYWAGDIFIFPTHYEIFGLVLVEALACGLKLVSSPCPAAEDILDKCPEAGKIAPVGDTRAFAGAASTLLKTIEKNPGLSAGEKAFVENHDWPSIAKRILQAASA